MSTNPQSPQGSRSTEGAEGPIDVTPPPVSEWRQSPGPRVIEAIHSMAVQARVRGLMLDPAMVLAALAATPSQEEGPAGVDLEEADRLVTRYKDHGLSLEEAEQVVRMVPAMLSRLRAQAPASSPRDLPPQRPYELKLYDRADGVKGHFCIGRIFESIYHEFWSEEAGKFCSAGTVFTLAEATEKLKAVTLAAHPPKGETPSEAAELERAKKACTRYKGDLETVIRELENDLAIAEAAPGTPIEKAAREGGDPMGNPLAWMLKSAEARSSDPKARTITLKFTRATLEMWMERARASLSSLPQEGGEPAGGWYDPAHDCEDHCTMCQGLKARMATRSAERAPVKLEIGKTYASEKGRAVTIDHIGRQQVGTRGPLYCDRSGKFGWLEDGTPPDEYYQSAIRYGRLVEEIPPFPAQGEPAAKEGGAK